MFRMYDQYSSVIRFSELKSPDDTWELLDLIGEGTYGEVYSAKHKVTGELAAVKILESIHEIIEEIEEEYRVLNDFNDHRNMPKFHGLYLKSSDTGSDDQLWLVMELCTRGSVTDLAKSLLSHGKHMDEMLIAYILKETLQVLNFLHKNHVIHRDVKGHNILVTENGHIKLIDFGVSGHLSSTMAPKKTSVGTPYWMAPEVIACERQLDYIYDIRCDVWSLGITAIELVDGEPPFADKHPMRALFRIPRNPPPHVKNPNSISASCKDFIARCLIKDYEQRPFVWTLLNHPFIQQVPDDTSQLRQTLATLTAQVERVIHEPDVTTKQGKLKSRRTKVSHIATTEDLTKLEALDEEAIVSQLFTRYSQAVIYTYIGDILLAVNPFTPLTIYNEEHARKYINAAKSENPPHIFAIADQAYQMMIHQKKHQCIVISGESGAGKTESANFLVQQLTLLGKAPNRDLEEKILQVNPLMEAFGNAKTVINDNSSRFGKYLEMFYTVHGTVTGAKITEYLLEKSRVIYQAQGEQNFHIFYYVHDGLPSEDKSHKYHLQDKASYKYISGYVPNNVATLSVNRVKFKAIQHCFDIIGFKPEEVSSVLGVIAAILHTGNIEFQPKVAEGYSGDGVKVENPALMEIVAGLLGLEAKDVVDVLETTGMVARGEVIIRENSMHEAVDVRDAMAKSLYGRLFSWIVNKINTLLQPDKHVYKVDNLNIVGLLDIFGFENFTSNSFEQLCINIANEQIQYYFNQHIFAWEMQEYKNEGVDGSVITFVDNRPLLDMFLMKPMGLLALLDEESHFPKATDNTLVEKFNQNVKSPFYSRPKSTQTLFFHVKHYAGQVQYDATGFLEKNRDRLPAEIVNLMRASDNSVVRSLFQTPLTKTGNLAGGSLKPSANNSELSSPSSTTTGVTFATVQSLRSQTSSMGGSRGSSSTSMTRVQQTVATYFRFSLMDLLSKMVAGSPHFVRCIRPNEDNLPDQFDGRKVTVQLTYTGVLETTRIRREGYSHRLPFPEFIKRYSVLAMRQANSISMDKAGCRLLLERLGLTDWALGYTKVFLKFYHIELLSRRFEDLQTKVIKIQAVFRMVISRNRYYELKWRREKATRTIQRYTRGWLMRKEYRKVKNKRQLAAIHIQRVLRGYLTRKSVAPVLQNRRVAALKIQSMYRGHRARSHVRQQRDQQAQSAIAIQKAFRRHQDKVHARQARVEKQRSAEEAAVMIQKYYRRWRCKTVYQQLQKFKDQKETQAIYFTQQVEAYANDAFARMTQSSSPVKPVPEVPRQRSPSPQPGPSTDPGSQPAPRKKRRAPARPKEDEMRRSVKVSKPDVSEERLDHMAKMGQTKQLIPNRELQYYSSMSPQNEDRPDGAYQDINGNGLPSHKMSKKLIMDPDAENYYSTVVKRSALNTSREEEKMALGESAATIADTRTVLDWDQPIVEAQQRALTSENSLDDGNVQAPPSPPMQMSPFDMLSDNASIPESSGSSTPSTPKLHVEVSSIIKTPTSSYTNSSHSTLKDFTTDQSILSSAHPTLSPGQLDQLDIHYFQSTNPFNARSLNIDQLEIGSEIGSTSTARMDQLEVSSEHSSTSTARNSVTSQDIALNMLDDAIDENLSAGRFRKTNITDRERERLARTVAEAFIANKPHSRISRKELSWDAPFHAVYDGRPLGLAHCSGPLYSTSIQVHQPDHHPVPHLLSTQPIHDIDDDLKTDRDEFYSESDKHELLETLREQHAQSARGKWQMLQILMSHGFFTKQPDSSLTSPQEVTSPSQRTNQRHYFDHMTSPSANSGVTSPGTNEIQGNYHMVYASTNETQASDHMGFESYTSRQRAPSPLLSKKTVIPVTSGVTHRAQRHDNRLTSNDASAKSTKVKFSAGEPTVIDVKMSHNNSNNILKTNHNVRSPPTGNHGKVVNYRSHLKQTRINPEHTRLDTHDDDKPVYDFRKMLKKTGRLDFIEQEQ